MASTLIHMVVGKKIGERLNKKSYDYELGVIAPDLSKLIGASRKVSHFIDGDDNIPNIDRFLLKYQDKLNNDFVLGYYVHIYTDYLWSKYFIPEILDRDKNFIKHLDGKEEYLDHDTIINYIYNDYTNLNNELLSKYDMDLALLDIKPMVDNLNNIIEELDISKIDILIDKAKYIISKAKEDKQYIFNMENIENFIDLCDELIMANLKEVYL